MTDPRAIYRGPGGSGDAVADTSNESVTAVNAAAAALASQTAAAASAAEAANYAANSLQAANNLSDLDSVATARTNLGLGTAATTASSAYATAAQGTKADSALQTADIGTSVQAYDADLTTLGAGGSSARSFLGLTIGTDVQAYDSNLTSFVNTFTLPTTDSTSGYLLKTDGAGNLSFVSPSAGSGTVTSVAMSVPTGLSISGSPITTSGTLALSLTSGYSIPTTSSQTNWDSAYTQRLQWDGGSTNLTASTGRTSLGATTVGANLFTLTNPSAISFPRFNADNSITAMSAPQGLANLIGYTTTATGTGSTTLTNTSSSYQRFTGTSGRVITLPVVSTLATGWTFYLSNNTTSGNLTVESSGGNSVISVPPYATAMITCISISGTTNTSWKAELTGFEFSASSAVNGYLSSTDWSTFNGKYSTGGALGTPSSGTLTNCTGLPIGGISATGTPSSTTYLRGDGTWSTVSGGGSGTVTSVSGTGTVNGITLTGTVTTSGSLTLGGTLGSIANSQLTNSSVTFNGQAVALGASGTITANTTNALTIGTGLSGTSFNGSSAVTVAIDSTVATLTGSQTLTNKTLTDPTITGTIIEDVYALTDGATVDIDPSNGSIQTLTLAGTARTLTFTNMVNGEAITLMVNDGTSGTITTWNATFVNNAGAAPTLSTSGYSVISIWKVAGVVYAAVVGTA